MTSRTIASAALVLVAAVALAGESSVSVKGLGSAEVRWNAVPYREELVAQLAPGLTWRLGREGPTRLDLRKMALSCPRGGLLLPEEQTLNLRYWSDERWELVVFAEERWNWGEDVTEHGVFPASVGKASGTSQAAKELDLGFRRTTRGDPTPVPGPAVTGEEEDLRELWEVPDDVAYTVESRRAFEALPFLELQMRFGPYVGTVGFEPVATRTLEARIERDGAEPVDFELVAVELPAPRVRSEYLEDHEGEIEIGVLRGPGLPAGGALLGVSGGELPMLVTKTRTGGDLGGPVEGRRLPLHTEKAVRVVETRIADGELRVAVGAWEYVFELAGVLDE